MTPTQLAAQKTHLAIDALERIALDFPTAGRGIERVLALYLCPVREALDSLVRESRQD